MADRGRIDISAERVEKIACRKCGRHMDVSSVEPFSKVECPDCGTKQRVPMRLGQFLLLEVLGRGGMGVVYRALDQSLGRYVAIKVMRQSLGEDKHFVENFFREARAAAALNHRNVVQIYSCGEERGQPYIVMELVDGGRLDAIIADGNPMDEVRAMEIAIDVAEGLKAANDIGLIHGDIKPANILFDNAGTAKVVDFGLARFVNWRQDQQEQPQEIWGTPYYIAPEKARGQKVDHRSDIYSLGATLYHALGAKPPFDGQTATDVVLARLKSPAIGLRVIRPSLQPETADVTSRMLEADPFMRYPTYASLLADMREALRVAKQENRMLHTKGRKSTSAPLVVAGVIALAVLALGIGGFRMVHKSQKKVKKPPKRPPEKVVVIPEEKPPEGPTVRIVPPLIQPFTEEWGQEIEDAFRALADGKSLATQEKLQGVYDRIPEGTMGRYWVRLFQAVPCWYEGRNGDARAYLQDILEAPFGGTPEGERHPGQLLRALAEHIIHGGDEGPLYIEASNWPPWMGDVVEFYVGLTRLRDDRLGESSAHFRTYLAKQGEPPAWAYAMQPVARSCLDQQERWSRLVDNLSEWTQGKQSRTAKEALERFRSSSSALFDPMVDKAMQTVLDAERREAEEQYRAARIAHQKQVQENLDALDEMRTANLPLVAAKDYRKASAALSKVLPKMTTPEGQQSFRILQDSYEEMNDLKMFLIESIEKEPYQGGSDLGGRAVGANLSGIRVSLGGHGVMLKPWDQVSIRQMIKMSTFYLEHADMDVDERAELYTSLAILCYQSAGFKAASKYAQLAADAHPPIKTEIRRFMPDIIED